MNVAIWDCRRCNHMEPRVASEWGKLCPKCGAEMVRAYVREGDVKP